MVDSITKLYLDNIANSLSQIREIKGEIYSQSTLKEAAVLIPLFYQRQDWHLLFIRRTDTVNHHKGQVAYPGGLRESVDRSLVDTALRETYEEIGLNPEDVTILGKLDPVISTTNYNITPIVGYFVTPYTYKPSMDEVSRIFSIPLNWLSNKSNFEEKMYVTPEGEKKKVVYYQEYDKEILWGITARITLFLLNKLDTINK